MHNLSALAFAEKGTFTGMRAFAGDVLYTEGMPNSHMYVIKEGEVDTYDLAKVIASVDNEALKQKLLAALSRSRREEVEADLKDMPAVDPIEVQQIGNSIVHSVKALMTGGRA